MSKSSKKLRYRRGGKDYAISLYTTSAEVGSHRARVRVGNADLYAKLGSASDPNASHLRIRKSNTDYAFLFEALEQLPTGFIGMFSGSCPSGWTRDSAFDNRFLRGASSYGGTGGAAAHTHTYSIPTVVSSTFTDLMNYRWLNDSGTAGNFKREHNHTYSVASAVTTTSTDNQPPYRKIVFCRKA